MIYGRATVEMVERLDLAEKMADRGWSIVERNAHGCAGLVWARVPVFSFVESRKHDGATYDIVGFASGWQPTGNWRNFAEQA